MPKKNHPRISQVDWEIHKETIRKMYLSEDKSLMGEGGVIDLMKRKGFSASKSQYESQFITWGFAKKLTRETWHIIGHIIKDRDEAGFPSRVYAYGTSLTVEKVKKETARYKCEANEVCYLKKELPTGVEVRADHEDDDQDEAKETIVETEGVYLNSLQTTSPSSNLHAIEESWNAVSDYDFYQINNPNYLCDRVLIDHPTPNFYSYTHPSFRHWDTFPLVTSTRRSPSTFSPGIREFQNIPRSTISLFTDLNKPLFRGFRALFRNNQSNVLASINQTKHLLPGEPGQELQRSSVDVVILKQILYLLMNNFAGSDYAAFDTIFEQVRQFSVAHMEDILDALPHPYAAALQQSILTIAIKSNIPDLVSVLLRRGLEINMAVCRFRGREYTPLGLACEFRSLEIVKILLGAGADPNRIIHQDRYSNPMLVLSGIVDQFGSRDSRPIDVDILQCLLKARARMPFEVFVSLEFWNSETLTDVYIQHNKLPLDDIYDHGSFSRRLPGEARFWEGEKATAIFQSAFQGLALQHHSGVNKSYPHGILLTASYHGNSSLVNCCLERGLKPSLECLCQATYGNHLILVQRYLQLGVEVHGGLMIDIESRDMTGKTVRIFPSTVDSCLLKGDAFFNCLTTPFAEAIRYGRQDIVSLFKSYSLPQGRANLSCLGSAILAAAEIGNKDMIQELVTKNKRKFEMEKQITRLGIDLQPLLVSVAAATLRGHDDIVELLMMAGVRPNYTSIAAAILTRNARLLELFLNSTNSTESEAAIAYLAVRWGDLNVLRWLIDAGVSFKGSNNTVLYPLYLPSIIQKGELMVPLEEAIRQGDHEVVQLLLGHDADVNGCHSRDYISPLAHAIKSGHERLVQVLLDRGANPNDPYALQAAVKKSDKLVEVILVSFCQCYPDGNKSFAIPALREAIKNEDETLVSMLAGHTDVNMTIYLMDGYRNPYYLPSLLGEGIATGNIKIVQILLDSGGNPDSTVGFSDQGRSNAVLKAISTGNLDMVKLLHNAGANLNFSAILRITRTALQLAVELGHFEIVKFLLEQGVDVNDSPCIWEGGTALQYAAKTGSIRIAEMLIEHGADIDVPGSKYLGRTAFEFAAEHGRMDMLLLLFHRGVDILSDGGEQIRRAREFAEKNGQIAAKDLVEQLSVEAQRRVFSSSENNFSQGLAYTSGDLGLLGTEWI